MNPLPRSAAALVVCALVNACAGNGPQVADTAASRIPPSGDWFCQLDASGEGWDCVQDPELASDPQPERLPSPAPPAEPMSSPERPPLPLTPGPADGPDVEPGFDQPGDVLPPEQEPPAPEPQPQRAAAQPRPASLERTAGAAAPPASAAGGEEPEHVRLAYRPDRPVALTDLPAHFYAVQLLAMSSKEALEAFVAREKISGMSAARVERDGELFFVLLLGIYETVERARRAIASLPREIGGAQPWIRPLGSLQSAMVRADQAAGTRRY